MKNHKISQTDIWTYLTSEEGDTINKVERWKNTHEQDEELLHELVRLHEVSQNHEVTDAQINRARLKVFDAVRLNEKVIPHEKVIPLWKHTLKYAAVVVFACIGGLFAYQKSLDSPSGHLMTFATGYNEQKQISLPDGSSVWLNASSQISYDSKAPRTLNLEGEAFFDVAKDKEHPFTVETPDNIKITALGTSFNVKSYSNSTYTETVLITGIIAVRPKDSFESTVVLSPNEKARIERKSGELIVTKNIKTGNLFGWKEGRIAFNNKSLKEIADDFYIQRDVRFRFENSDVEKLKFTGSFDDETPVNEILEILKSSRNFSFHQNTTTKEWILK